MFQNLCVLKIKDLLTLHTLNFAHDLFNNKLPPYFSTFANNITQIEHCHNLRQRQAYRTVFVKHAFAQRTIRYFLPTTLNTTPKNVTDKLLTHSKKGFSNYVKTHLFSTYNNCKINNCYICQL